jgi:hypothetical protein
MNRTKLEKMSVDQLVEQFTAIALEQDRALDEDDTAEYNRLYDRLQAVVEELKDREGDQRRALLRLGSHRNAQVRLKSAIATLALAPEEARHVLQRIVNGGEYPQAMYARGMLRALDAGTYVPT